MNNKKRALEKQRLWDAVMKKKRTTYDEYVDEQITLEDYEQSNKDKISSKQIDGVQSAMAQADEMLHALKDVLNRQKADLKEMYQNLTSQESHSNIDVSIEQIEQDIKQDYGIDFVADKKERMPNIQVAFRNIRQSVDEDIVGQNNAIDAMCIAFKRPYIMGTTSEYAKNVIVVCGPNGSGKHMLIKSMANALYKESLLDNAGVSIMDMSLYQSVTQEQIFIQDLYRTLSHSAPIILFENFALGSAIFTRMLDQLVCNGRVILNKRYVNQNGILVENQTGLVKETVDALYAENKYLIFVTEKMEDIQDTFGQDFLNHVFDVIRLEGLTSADIDEMVEKRLFQFKVKVQKQLHMDIYWQETVLLWVKEHFDKTQGADGIAGLIDDFYDCLGQGLLQNEVNSLNRLEIEIENQLPYASFGNKKLLLSKQRNQQAEISLVCAELDKIVGLQQVKQYIHSLQSHIHVQMLRRQQGLKVSEISKHMIFSGNPGTGKTTIARLISRYMKAIGALSKGQLVEVTRADLVAQYVGQTAPLTMSVVKSALGGVLFIDEAYSLYRGKEDTFGLECIDTLVKAMEDYRSDFIVILAGYKKEMVEFLEANSGLRSRFPNVVYFQDYTGEELLQIAKIQAVSKGYRILEEAFADIQKYFEYVQQERAEEAGNGRLARNLIEDAILRQSNRLMKNSEQALDELKLVDFQLTIS